MTSERHPDRAVYLTPPPNRKNPWNEWVPDIVVEVGSPRQEKRDYVVKREEYLAAGIREYWIVDSGKRAVLRLVRRGDVWTEETLAEKGTLRTPLLPGFECPVASLFEGL